MVKGETQVFGGVMGANPRTAIPDKAGQGMAEGGREAVRGHPRQGRPGLWRGAGMKSCAALTDKANRALAEGREVVRGPPR